MTFERRRSPSEAQRSDVRAANEPGADVYASQAVTVAVTAMGLWLAASGYVWPHGDAVRVHDTVVGVCVALASVWLSRSLSSKPVDVLLAAWFLFVTPLIRYQVPATAWHNLVLSVAMILTALGRTHLVERV